MRANDDVEIYLRFPDLQYHVGQRSERIPVRLIIQRSSFLVLALSLILSFSIYIYIYMSVSFFPSVSLANMRLYYARDRYQ